MTTDQQLAEMNRQFNAIINKHFPGLFGGGASYRYYSPSEPRNKSRSKDKYFYTVHRVNHKGSSRFVSGIYRYNASKRRWRAMKEAGHAKKKDAIARALKLADNNA